MNARTRRALGLESLHPGETAFGVDLAKVAPLDPAHIPADLAAVTIQGVKVEAKPAEPLPSDFINVKLTAGLWYIDRVRIGPAGQRVESIAARPVERYAMAFARGYAGRMGLPIHVGPYTLPAVTP